MIKTNVSKSSFWENKVDGYCFLLGENFELNSEIKELEKCYPNLKDVLDRHKFEGKLGQTFSLSCLRNGNVVTVFFVGIGDDNKPWDRRLENLRRGLGSMVLAAKKINLSELAVKLPSSEDYGIDSLELIKQASITTHMAGYEFINFKNDKDEYDCTIHFVTSDDISSDATGNGDIVGRAINLTRQWTDMPPNILTPTELANEAKKIAEKTGMKFNVFGRDKAIEMGMGGFCCVDAGSTQDGKFITLEYKVSNDAPTVALVGKGVTFDTGGVSLKPSAYMTGMKHDMAGAAVVLGAINAIAQLKPNVNVVAIAPAVENMPSGSSSRQDDIVTFMNGKTAEIISTDAEGRLILADALCYAEKYYKPDVIVDVATLTGACVVALGHSFTGLMSRDDSLSDKLIKTGQLTGDRLCRLPLDDDFIPAIKSKVADLANCGARDYGAGSITAGLFLENFVETTPWAHFDIAGTADGVKNVSYLGNGATGSCLKLLVEFAINFTK